MTLDRHGGLHCDDLAASRRGIALPEAPGAADAAGELHGEEDEEDEEAEEGNRNGGERYRRAAEDALAAEGADHLGDEAVKKLHQLLYYVGAPSGN